MATLVGVAICLVGIALCGVAGLRKEKELSAEQKQDAVGEFSFVKGVLVAVVAGVMSACMAFAIAAGKPIAEAAIAHGTESLWSNLPVFIVAFRNSFPATKRPKSSSMYLIFITGSVGYGLLSG